MKIFHRDIYWPDFLPTRLGSPIRVRPSRHAIERASEKLLDLPLIVPAHANLIEAYMERGELVKLLVRYQVKSHADLCLILSGRLIVTAWLNQVNDVHSTLDKNKYEKPPIRLGK